MRPPLRCLNLAATALVLSLSVPLHPTPYALHPVQAQPTSDRTIDSPALQDANRLFQQGTQQIEQKQFQAALESFQQALAIYQNVGDRNGVGQTLKNIGNSYLFLQQYETAILYQQ